MRKCHEIFSDILADAKQNKAAPWDGLCFHAIKMGIKGELPKGEPYAVQDYMSKRLEAIQDQGYAYLVTYLQDKHPDASKEEIESLWYQWYENEINTLKEWGI